MKVAIVGSRSLTVNDLWNYLPEDVTEIVSGGAIGIDACAREYALNYGIRLTEFYPEYGKYGRSAPIKRNQQIIDYADMVIAFWNGTTRGTFNVIDKCRKIGKEITVYMPIYPNSTIYEKLILDIE